MININKEREAFGLDPIVKTEEYITITRDEFRDLLIIKGKYEELSQIYYRTKPQLPTLINVGSELKTEPKEFPAYQTTCGSTSVGNVYNNNI